MTGGPDRSAGRTRTIEASRAWLRCLCDTARLMVGQPSYETYLEHMRRLHPDRAPMTRTEFFRDREAARFGGGGGGLRCC